MIAAIIQARLGSTRLPGKTMKGLCGKPLLYYSVKRSSFAKYVDGVIVATTTSKGDEEIVQWCEENNIPYYRGSEEDVLDRYHQTAKKFGVDIVVRVTSDCPFIDPEVIDMLILALKNFDYDYVSNRIKKRTWPHGLDAEVFTVSALEKAWGNAQNPIEREHVTPYILTHPELFKIYEVPNKRNLSHIRLTVDYLEDYEFTKKLMSSLMEKYGETFRWKDILEVLDENPEILKINGNRLQHRLNF